ncbi:tetratricopeptide repeat protein, partial [Candidatus Albibeggiatoa sp. nov. BB20]|uniref:tetratricopeptide repeat protein n=1 Tax=Candidatus Albibeggiatoa sp. nov. BB20 TaxID=3162723 RepID=UPI0033653160
VLGKQHPDYATSLNNLASLYDAQGQYQQALPLYEQAIDIFVNALGEEHPNTKIIKIIKIIKRNYQRCLAAVERD